MSARDGGPAFPSHGSMGELATEGMTLRDYFAAKAMQGELAATQPDGSCWTPNTSEALAKMCYRYADAMLAERAK